MKLHVRRTLAAAGLLASLTVAFAAHAKFKLDGGGKAMFEAKGVGGLKIEGKTSSLKVSEEGGKVVFIANLKDLDTGIKLRDGHLQDALKGVNTAKLIVAKDSVKLPGGADTLEGKTKGTLVFLKGDKEHSKGDVNVSYKLKRNGDGTYEVKGDAPISLKKFNIEAPSYMGVGVKDDVSIMARGKLRDG